MFALVLVLLTAVNCLSTELANSIQIFFMIAKTIALIIIILGGLVKIGQGNEYVAKCKQTMMTSRGVFRLHCWTRYWF